MAKLSLPLLLTVAGAVVVSACSLPEPDDDSAVQDESALTQTEAQSCKGTLRTTDTLNVRRGPGTTFAKAESGALLAGTAVTLHESQKDASGNAAPDPWVRLGDDEGGARWVHAGYLRCEGANAPPGGGGADTTSCADLVTAWKSAATEAVGFIGCSTANKTCGGVRKNNQYESAIVKSYGYLACGLVSAAAAVPASKRLEEIAAVRAAAGEGYGPKSGIQPHDLARAMGTRYPEGAVKDLDRQSLLSLHQAVGRGDLVVADFLATEAGGRSVVTTTGKTFAHFARVVGLDPETSTVFVENSLSPSGDSVYVVDAATFCEAWKTPEVAAAQKPSGVALDAVSRWVAVVAADAVDGKGRGCAGLENGPYCGESIGAKRGVLYECANDAARVVSECVRGCNVAPPGTPDSCAP